jgi:hypothetical protein
MPVHRVAYEAKIGSIPTGHQIDHKCHNRACVSKSHLRLATNKQNGENREGANWWSKTGLRGVSWHVGNQMWRARVSHHGHEFVRYCRSKEEAVVTAAEMRSELFTHNVESAR